MSNNTVFGGPDSNMCPSEVSLLHIHHRSVVLNAGLVKPI